MSLRTGAELAWFLSGAWAVLFILRASRSTQSGFFAVAALLVVAVLPALGLLYESQLTEFAKRVQQVIR